MINASTTLERLESRDEQINLTLKNLLETAENTRVLVNLDDPVWPSYLRRIQSVVVNSIPRYLAPTAGKKVLTEEGRNLLDTELTDKIERIYQAEPDFDANLVILRLDTEYLFNKARENGVSLDIMIAVVNRYIEEILEGQQ